MDKEESVRFKKLQQAILKAEKDTVDQLTKDKKKYFNSAVKAFYDDYEPLVYKRKYLSYKALVVKKKKNYDSWQSEHFIDSNKIKGNPYGPDKSSSPIPKTEWVMMNTFIKGSHGYKIKRKMKYSPSELFEKYLQENLTKDYIKSIMLENIKKYL